MRVRFVDFTRSPTVKVSLLREGDSDWALRSRGAFYAMDAKTKATVAKEHRLHAKDTGSSDVQVALLTHHINELAEHLKRNKKDNSSRRGLLRMVALRRRLLDYLHRTEAPRYQKLLKQLNLRK
jgi:small subunit ribosomal protein S15